jgi:hypothetical protein
MMCGYRNDSNGDDKGRHIDTKRESSFDDKALTLAFSEDSSLADALLARMSFQ